MKRKLITTCLGLMFAMGVTVAHADVIFNGFGQTVVGTSLSNNKPFPYSAYTADPSFQPESNFALQASASLTDSISAVAQVLALGANDFQPKFQWAYLKFQFNNIWALKVGRVNVPLYKFSDFLYLGQAYPWVTPPQSVYVTSPFTNADGLTLSADMPIGNWDFYSQFHYATTSVTPVTNNPNGQATAQFKNALLFSEDATYKNWLSLHATVVGGKLTAQLNCDGSIAGNGNRAVTAFQSCPVNYVLDSLGTLAASDPVGYSSALKNAKPSNDLAVFWSLGSEIDRGQWTLIAEYIGFQAHDSFVGDYENGYITVGRHFGKLMPLLTYGHYNSWFHDKATSSLPAGAVDSNIGLTFQEEFALIGQSTSERVKDNFYSLGLRYDLKTNVALKFDWTHYHSDYDTPTFADPVLQVASGLNPAPFTRSPDSNRVSAAITFAF